MKDNEQGRGLRESSGTNQTETVSPLFFFRQPENENIWMTLHAAIETGTNRSSIHAVISGAYYTANNFVWKQF